MMMFIWLLIIAISINWYFCASDESRFACVSNLAGKIFVFSIRILWSCCGSVSQKAFDCFYKTCPPISKINSNMNSLFEYAKRVFDETIKWTFLFRSNAFNNQKKKNDNWMKQLNGCWIYQLPASFESNENECILFYGFGKIQMKRWKSIIINISTWNKRPKWSSAG